MMRQKKIPENKYELVIDRWVSPAFPDGKQRIGFNSHDFDEMIEMVFRLQEEGTEYCIWQYYPDGTRKLLGI